MFLEFLHQLLVFASGYLMGVLVYKSFEDGSWRWWDKNKDDRDE